MYFLISLLFLSLVSLQVIQDDKIDYNDNEIKCLDIEAEMARVPPAKKMPKDFRIDGEGNIGKPNIEYRRSDAFLIDVMENICDRMENVVKAKHKTTGEMMLFTLAVNGNRMNPLINDIDLPEDSGFGNNPRIYCEEMIEKYDDEILRVIQR